jgi:hypothetical protein
MLGHFPIASKINNIIFQLEQKTFSSNFFPPADDEARSMLEHFYGCQLDVTNFRESESITFVDGEASEMENHSFAVY